MNEAGVASMVDESAPRFDWTIEEVLELFELPFTELVFRAAKVHRVWFNPAELQLSQLLSIKTGGCSEDCGYCAQSQHFETGISASKLVDVDAVVAAARDAKQGGAQRFCMGAAWRELKDRDLPKVAAMIERVKALGLETCATLGMLTLQQAKALKSSGLDYYNHNLDTGRDYYGSVVTTRTYQDRLDTLAAVRNAGLATCCGGILGMGETRRDRASMLHELATMTEHPASLPLNALVPVPGTPLSRSEAIAPLEFIRTVAVARIICPASVIRLAAGRDQMSAEQQALCFVAGANSIFIGRRLLTTDNSEPSADERLLAELKMQPMRERGAGEDAVSRQASAGD